MHWMNQTLCRRMRIQRRSRKHNPENGEETPSKDAENKEGQPEDTNLDFDEIGDSEGNDQITTYSNQVTFLNNGYPYKKWVTDNFKKVISLLNQIL